MFRSLKLGTAFGIDVYVHWSFPLLLLAVAFLNQGGGSLTVLFGIALVLLVFGCIILHEFGHALVARHYGIMTRDITIYPIGGVARLEKMSEKPWEELMIAVAGPAVNVVIALLLTVLLCASLLITRGSLAPLADLVWAQESASLGTLVARASFAQVLLVGLIISNLFLVLFNMIPAFPMDGGRVFRALLAAVIGHLPATEVAAALSLVLAVGMSLTGMGVIQVPFLGANPMLIVVSMFVLLAGQQELAAVRYRVALRNAPPVDVLPAYGRPVQVSAAPPEPGFSGFTWDRAAGFWIEWRDGRPVHACHVPHP
jgi:Zn-dependent protease